MTEVCPQRAFAVIFNDLSMLDVCQRELFGMKRIF